jgi:Tfp pilus assembly protein PilO
MRWKDIDSQTRLTKVKLQKSLSIIKDKERIDKEYAAYADRLKPKSSDEEELTSILNELETLARNANLKIVSMRPRQPKDMDYYKTFTVEADTESDMGSLMKFIYDVKNSQQLIKIDKLNINTKSSQEGVIIKAAMVISKISL